MDRRRWSQGRAGAGTAYPEPLFGETVTVTGLLTGRDILEQLDTRDADEALLCDVTLREAGDLFLDDLSLEEFKAQLPLPLTVTANRGDALFNALLG